MADRNEHFLWTLLVDLISAAFDRIDALSKRITTGSIKIHFPITKREMQYIAGKAYQHSIMRRYHSLFSKEFKRRLNKFVWFRFKDFPVEQKAMFEKYTDCN